MDRVQTFAATCSGFTNKVCLETLPNASADSSFVQMVIQMAIGVIAAVAVLFIAIGGVRYIMSQGDPQGVSKAKSTIVYALIGLAVAIMAQAIVIFVTNEVFG